MPTMDMERNFFGRAMIFFCSFVDLSAWKQKEPEKKKNSSDLNQLTKLRNLRSKTLLVVDDAVKSIENGLNHSNDNETEKQT